MVRNLTVTRVADRYEIAEQAGSNYKQSRVIDQAASLDEVQAWLVSQGAPPEDVQKALGEFPGASQVLIEIPAASEHEGFPRQ